jgi:hypothetical protein
MVYVDSVGIIGRKEGLFRTGFDTLVAVETAVWEIPELLLIAQSFGILTPKASKWTSFEEYSGPDSITVMDCKPFDIEDQTLHHSSPYVVLAMISSCKSEASSVK